MAALADPNNTKTLSSAAKYSVTVNQGAEKATKMNISNVYPGKWLKAADLAGQVAVLEIADANMEELQTPDGKRQSRLVLRFADSPKAMVVNKTNLLAIGEFLGEETNDWVGQRIEVYPDRTDLGGKRVPCVRVRAPTVAEMNWPGWCSASPATIIAEGNYYGQACFKDCRGR